MAWDSVGDLTSLTRVYKRRPEGESWGAAQEHKSPGRVTGAFVGGHRALTMTYFHAVIPRTIIGAAAFHGPVRDGKAWFHRAMVVRNG